MLEGNRSGVSSPASESFDWIGAGSQNSEDKKDHS